VKLLLDTCAFLWLARNDPRASPWCRDAFLDANNEAVLSSVSACEIAIKYRLGKLPLPRVPELYIPGIRQSMGVDSLTLDELDALNISQLPDLHKDPFDRLLISQAMRHGMTIVTPDAAISQYGVPTLW
jgi:PIN domain nuclease of toxin-antitoxin system